MGPLFEFSWRVGKNTIHTIPEGASIYFEGGSRLCFRFDVERSGLAATLKVSSEALRRETEPAIYWQVGKNVKHYIPEGARVLARLHKDVGIELLLDDWICRMNFSYAKVPAGRRVNVRHETSSMGLTNGSYNYYVYGCKKSVSLVDHVLWSLKLNALDLSKAS